MMTIQRFCHALVSMALVAILAVILGWSSIMRFAIGQNLDEYAKAVRVGSCSVEEKVRLLDLIDGLEVRLDSGLSISTFRWMRYDQAIQPLLVDGITSDRAQLIERELLKARDDFVSAEKERTAKP